MVKKNKLFRDVFYDDRDDILSKKHKNLPQMYFDISPLLIIPMKTIRGRAMKKPPAHCSAGGFLSGLDACLRRFKIRGNGVP